MRAHLATCLNKVTPVGGARPVSAAQSPCRLPTSSFPCHTASWLASPLLALALSPLPLPTALAGPLPPSSIPLTPTALASGGRITVDQGIELVTIGSPGNAAWTGDGTPQDRAIGRGSVGYEYRIGRMEVTTAQWVEFYNAAFDRPANDRIPHLIPSDHWGAQPTQANTPGGQRWTVPNGNAMRPVGDISWRMAAIYCNWLHNGKATNREAFLTGAYDVSTFGLSDNGFTDQATRSPGAKFFIPTWDEWLKAAHYDPNKNGQDQGGWWKWSDTSDDFGVVPGPPPSIIPGGGTGGMDGEANSGGWVQIYPQLSPFTVSLGAYPTVQSPWGLLDVAGATTEWTEEIITIGGANARAFDGSFWFDGPPQADRISSRGGATSPNVSTFEFGFRIAASIPAPPSIAVLAMGMGVACSRRRKGRSCTRGGTSRLLSLRLCLRRAGRSGRMLNSRASAIGGVLALLIPAVCASAGPLPPSGIPLTPTALASGGRITVDQGIELVTIGSPGNAPWTGDGTPQDRAIGRGSVGYEYRIGRMEVTTAQWVEFYNAAFDRPANDRIPHLIPSDHWGAQPTQANTPGGMRWTVPNGNGMRPVGDISWRMAAIYCNWLHNGKATNREAFLSGAYDVSTFGLSDNGFTDQATRSTSAKFFIPTWDEWLKAAHYDPNKNGQDQGGWWKWSDTSDTVGVIPGPPPSIYPGGGTGGMDGEANSGAWGHRFPDLSPFTVSLGAYPTVQSPWGLLDVAGATAEWTEGIFAGPGAPPVRVVDGSWWFDGSPLADYIGAVGTSPPNVSTFDYGFRIAAAIPSPASGAMFALGLFLITHRSRR